MKLLLIDDDIDIVENNAEYLERKGYEILRAYDGTSALALANQADLIVLDVGLPDTDGFTLATKLAQYTAAPILFLTARSDDHTIEEGFRLGYDFMKKPYSIKELFLRIQSILTKKMDSAAVIHMPPLSINTITMTITVAQKPIVLTPREFSLFMLLIKAQGEVVSYLQLYEPIWGNAGFSVSIVAQHISALKRKIENGGTLKMD